MRILRALAVSGLCVASAANAQVPWQAETVPQGVSDGPVAIARSTADGGTTRVVTGSPLGTSMFSFALDGGLVQYVQTGVVHGLATISGLTSPTAPRDLVIATGYVTSQLYVMGLDDQGQLVNALSGTLNTTTAPGALALSLAPDGGLEAIWEVGTGDLKRITLFDDGAGHYSYVNDPPVTIQAQPTALAVDDDNRRLYAVIPQLGIVALSLDVPAATPELVEPVDGGALGGLPSGLALYMTGPGLVHLVVSVPLTNEFIVYRLDGVLVPATRFTVAQDGGTPTVTFSQQLAITTAPVEGFPRGLMVVQDPNNPGGSNYKLVDLGEAQAHTSPPLPLPPVILPGSDAGAPDGGSPDAGVRADGGHGGSSSTPPLVDPGGDEPVPRPCGCGLPSPLLPAAVVVISALLERRRRSRTEQ